MMFLLARYTFEVIDRPAEPNLRGAPRKRIGALRDAAAGAEAAAAARANEANL